MLQDGNFGHGQDISTSQNAEFQFRSSAMTTSFKYRTYDDGSAQYLFTWQLFGSVMHRGCLVLVLMFICSVPKLCTMVDKITHRWNNFKHKHIKNPIFIIEFPITVLQRMAHCMSNIKSTTLVHCLPQARSSHFCHFHLSFPFWFSFLHNYSLQCNNHQDTPTTWEK